MDFKKNKVNGDDNEKLKPVRNYIWRPFVIFFLSTIFLIIIQLLDFNPEISGFRIKKINLFLDIVKKKEKKKITSLDNKHFNINESTNIAMAGRLKPEKSVELSENFMSQNDSSVNKNEFCKTEDFNTDRIVDFSHKRNDMKRLAAKLKQVKMANKKVRIAYYGDSVIEGDILVQDFRNYLQDNFGGRNVGFVPVTSVFSGFRQTIFHSYSPDWQTYSFLSNEKNVPLGISGYTYIPKILNYDSALDENAILKDIDNSSWTEYRAAKIYKTLQFFNSVSIYYSHVKTKSYAVFTIDDTKRIIRPLEIGEDLETITITPDKVFRKVKINILSNAEMFIYGVNFDDKGGVYIDNFSYRGISGIEIKKIDGGLIKKFNDILHYDLIILQYGSNIIDPVYKTYKWYQRQMVSAIKYINENIKTAAVLTISVHDISIKNDNGEYDTNPRIPLLVKEQYNIANLSKSSFWNLYYVMGSEKSMVRYVENKQANYDFTHFNMSGGRILAELLYRAIINKKDN
ncbi:MAG: hypothetical protein AB1498_02105 [bacterium]